MNQVGKNIENKSFQIIREELGPVHFSPEEMAIVVRMIHATGDFDYAANVRFSPDGIASGREALRNGCLIFADVKMVQAGITTRFMPDAEKRVLCRIDDPETAALARKEGITRSAAEFRLQKEKLEGAVIAIGNAPTALLEVLNLCRTGEIHPALIVGVPVGFVNAAESKAQLADSHLSYITSLGRKGGSSVAAAIINALNAEDSSL